MALSSCEVNCDVVLIAASVVVFTLPVNILAHIHILYYVTIFHNLEKSYISSIFMAGTPLP